MSKGHAVPAVPKDAPFAGEVYRHYKGDLYKVVGLTLHSDETWLVVYEPMYDGAVSKLFSRPVTEWRELVSFDNAQVPRFVKP